MPSGFARECVTERVALSNDEFKSANSVPMPQPPLGSTRGGAWCKHEADD